MPRIQIQTVSVSASPADSFREMDCPEIHCPEIHGLYDHKPTWRDWFSARRNIVCEVCGNTFIIRQEAKRA